MWIFSPLLFLDAFQCVREYWEDKFFQILARRELWRCPLRVLACVETEAGAPLSALWPLRDNGYFTPASGGWVWLPSPAAVVRALRPSRSFCGPSVLTLLPGWEWRGRACDWAGLFLGRAASISCRGPLTWDKCLQGT